MAQVTLDELLRSRDERAVLQQSFLGEWPGAAVLCLTVQLPGPEKRNELSMIIARAAVEAIQEAFPEVLASQLRDLETGYEGYFVVSMPALEAKRIACGIEDTHRLGRLMDIDVITADGPVSRADIGLPERKCLLCDKPARYCMRARSHSVSELLAAIEDICRRQ